MSPLAPAGGPPRPVLSLRGASFGYGDQPVVRNVDLDVRAGERVAVLGANGSGKSTLAKGILGLNDRMAGRVELFGTPARQFRHKHWIGYVPQRHTLSSAVIATVGEVVATGRLPRRRWYVRAGRSDRAAIARSLELVDLAGMANRPVSALSGGQQRRVLIARVLAAQARLLILDEPTAGVDVSAQRALADALTRIAEQGAGMMVITHDLDILGPLFTRVVSMSAGAVERDLVLESASRTGSSCVPHRGAGAHLDTGSARKGGLSTGPAGLVAALPGQLRDVG